jgi:cell division septum initiation protein DivIVA
MHNLKKNILGSYRAEDVDKLLSKVRIDYEKCLKEQKERIIKLREENREMAAVIEKYKVNERLIVEAITRAEETAQSIVGAAEKKAKERLARVVEEEKQIRMTIEAGCQRLYKLRRASEAIYRAIARTMGDRDDQNPASAAMRPVVNLYDGAH